MNHSKANPLFVVLTAFSFLCLHSVLYATSTGRNGGKDNKDETIHIVKATKLGVKSYIIKRYGRNINILSNRPLKIVSAKKPQQKIYRCRRVVVKTRSGNRESLKICDKEIALPKK
jgi:hypothetical protein